ncbi:hypothetical protein AV521_32335 [Streptomyces sp. IMTB 2501]|nr:hypothetical protein AV521_32335 [Streptomyces sp. IMTB 2501]
MTAAAISRRPGVLVGRLHLRRYDTLAHIRTHRGWLGYLRPHGVNAQVVADPAGRPLWISPTLPDRAYELSTARAQRQS